MKLQRSQRKQAVCRSRRLRRDEIFPRGLQEFEASLSCEPESVAKAAAVTDLCAHRQDGVGLILGDGRKDHLGAGGQKERVESFHPDSLVAGVCEIAINGLPFGELGAKVGRPEIAAWLPSCVWNCWSCGKLGIFQVLVLKNSDFAAGRAFAGLPAAWLFRLKVTDVLRRLE